MTPDSFGKPFAIDRCIAPLEWGSKEDEACYGKAKVGKSLLMDSDNECLCCQRAIANFSHDSLTCWTTSPPRLCPIKMSGVRRSCSPGLAIAMDESLIAVAHLPQHAAGVGIRRSGVARHIASKRSGWSGPSNQIRNYTWQYAPSERTMGVDPGAT